MKSYQPPIRKPATGRLIWIETGTRREVVVASGSFASLQLKISQLRDDVSWKNGTFKITY